MRATRALRLVGSLVAFLSAAPLAYAGDTPLLVADLDSGRVLYAENATTPWFPASVTKLMTAYVALHEVKAGRASMSTLLTVSPEAAAMPPSKMAFKPGTEIRLDNALKIIMVKSANDVATTIAEGLAGSVEAFADKMNAAAARLGMMESRFYNPHGLPDERQQTSARDMALLARAVVLEFPEYRDLFAIEAIRFGKRVMKNHNGLIGRYEAVTGMKTGYICSSGFNVVATAERNGRRLVAVVMGSPSAKERTEKSAALLEYGFTSLGLTGDRLETLPRIASAGPPDLRPVICGKRKPAGEDDEDLQDAQAAMRLGTGNADNPSFNLFAGGALAFVNPSASPVLPKPDLPPRRALKPVAVWIGLEPPGASARAEGTTGKPAAAAVGAPIPLQGAVPMPPPRRTDPKAKRAETQTKQQN